MGMTDWLLVVIAGIGVLSLLWWLWAQNHPEDLADDGDREAKGPTAEAYPSGSRLAGPGAESQRPDGRPSGGEGFPRSGDRSSSDQADR
jgi:hypothetical protein